MKNIKDFEKKFIEIKNGKALSFCSSVIERQNS